MAVYAIDFNGTDPYGNLQDIKTVPLGEAITRKITVSPDYPDSYRVVMPAISSHDAVEMFHINIRSPRPDGGLYFWPKILQIQMLEEEK